MVAGVLGALGLVLVLCWLAWGRPLGEARQEREELRAARDELAGQLRTREAELAERGAEVARLTTQLEEREKAHADKLAELETRFRALAQDTLVAVQKQFVDQAAETLKRHQAEAGRTLSELVQPVKDTLGRFEEQVKAIEAKREQAYGSITEQIQGMLRAEEALRAEAHQLVAALRGSARATGQWGELQLQRVLELGGLKDGIDFTLQASSDGGEAARGRPDAIIHLPGDRLLVVDAKCALDDYMAAQRASTDAERAAARRRHAARLREHAKSLAAKAYWNQFERAPDYVLMFVPGENFLSAALEEDPDLHAWALQQRVLIVGPAMLLATARVVALTWRQARAAEEAQQIAKLGADLYRALATMAGHLEKLGHNLNQATESYNRLVGSLEANVLPKARRFPELGVDPAGRTIETPAPIEATVRPLPLELARIPPPEA